MIPRSEHPKPQFQRDTWLNLNGSWGFEFDHSNSGKEKGLYKKEATFSQNINVPFCPESKLSGIEYKDFMNSIWYKRVLTINKEQLNGRIVLHFGAVDYEAVLYINEKFVGTHKGGYSSFSFDITDFVTEGENLLVLNAMDDTRSPLIPSGKQSSRLKSYSCSYTRTTGIWQTVWLEFTPKEYIESVRYVTDIKTPTVTVCAKVHGKGEFKALVYFNGALMGEGKTVSSGEDININIPLKEKHLWDLGQGNLYDVVLTYNNDKVQSYFGLRSVELRGRKFLLNGKSVFQRLVLDQGYYPDGIYTAPADADLEKDIDLSMALGFNGARLHEKVFEERFLYHADRKGYMVWGEYANWGLDIALKEAIYVMLPEWIEILNRDINHPAIIGWCPFNETGGQKRYCQYDGVLELAYKTTKAIDSTRPCIDTSGYVHVITDIFDMHDYDLDVEKLKRKYASLQNEGVLGEMWCALKSEQTYDGKAPIFISEYGGMGFDLTEGGWGYQVTDSADTFIETLKGINDVFMDNPHIMGFCYTQLTDVEQEQNGLYNYYRKPKFPTEKIRPLFTRKAAIED